MVEEAVTARYGVQTSAGEGDASITDSDLETTRLYEHVTVPMSRDEQKSRNHRRRTLTGRDIIVHRDDQGLEPAALRSAMLPMDGNFNRFSEYRHLYLSQGLDLRTARGVDIITQVSTWCAYLNNNDDEDIARDIPPPYDLGESYREMIWDYLRLFYGAGHSALSREQLYEIPVEDLYSYYTECPIHGYVTEGRIPDLRIIQRIPLDRVTNELVIRSDLSINFEPDVEHIGSWEIKFHERDRREHITKMRIDNAERMSMKPHIYDHVWQPKESRWMNRYKGRNLKVRNSYVPSWRLPRIPNREGSGWLGERQLLEKSHTTIVGFPDGSRCRVPAWDNRHPGYRGGAFGKPHNKLYGHVDNPQVAGKLIKRRPNRKTSTITYETWLHGERLRDHANDLEFDNIYDHTNGWYDLLEDQMDPKAWTNRVTEKYRKVRVISERLNTLRNCMDVLLEQQREADKLDDRGIVDTSDDEDSSSEDGTAAEPTAHPFHRRDDPDADGAGGGTSGAGMLLSPGATHTGAASGYTAVGTAHAITVTVNTRSRVMAVKANKGPKLVLLDSGSSYHVRSKLKEHKEYFIKNEGHISMKVANGQDMPVTYVGWIPQLGNTVKEDLIL